MTKLYYSKLNEHIVCVESVKCSGCLENIQKIGFLLVRWENRKKTNKASVWSFFCKDCFKQALRGFGMIEQTVPIMFLPFLPDDATVWTLNSPVFGTCRDVYEFTSASMKRESKDGVKTNDMTVHSKSGESWGPDLIDGKEVPAQIGLDPELIENKDKPVEDVAGFLDGFKGAVPLSHVDKKQIEVKK